LIAAMRRFPFASAAARSFLVASCLACCGVSSAATVTLIDGTVIQGEVKSLQDGVYTIATASVGTLHVRARDVRSIDDGGKPPSASVGQLPAESSPGNVVDAAKAQITADPKLLATVLALQNDPEVLAILADPEVAKAMAAGDYNALMSNAKIVALMQNPKMREIIDALR
jgi:hypothetical protein